MHVVEVVALCGPTSSGKSTIGMRLAQALNGEVVNADSRQVYAEMLIGTGQPDETMKRAVPHHGYCILSPAERFSAGRFLEISAPVIAQVAARGRLPVVVGGTGLYLEVLKGSMPLDRPVADAKLKERVRREAQVHQQSTLHEWLSTISPSAAARVEPRDSYRTLRALEVCLALRDAPQRGRIMGGPTPAKYQTMTIVLQVDRAALQARIARRVEGMFQAGLVDEAVAVRARYGNAPGLSGLGYAEALAFYRGAATIHEAIRLTIRRTCQYAKRQQTWFARMRDALIIDATDVQAAAEAVIRAARERAV